MVEEEEALPEKLEGHDLEVLVKQAVHEVEKLEGPCLEEQ